MFSRLRTLPLAALAVLALIGLDACGDSHTRVSTGTYAGESGANAPYLDVGELTYQVQLSRQLNPTDVEDSVYLKGIPAAERQLAPGQEWFGVFLQVFNNTQKELPAVSSPTITDTQGNTYSPIIPDPSNDFAYRGGNVPPKSRLPVPGSVPSAGPTQGALLLYKIRLVSLDNRPLEFKVLNPSDPSQTAAAELDV